jgi:monoterpene epsilon-lactone hydrolase
MLAYRCLFSIATLAAYLVWMPAAPVSAASSEPAAPVAEDFVRFSPESPVPLDVSPAAQSLFLLRRPAPGTPPPTVLDCTNPAHQREFFQYRENLRQYWEGVNASIPPPFTRQATTIDGVNATWLTTPNTRHNGKVILFLHGGAYVLGNAHANCTGWISLVRQTGIPVLAVEYRLAPEAPFPAGLEDCQKVYRWLLQHGYSAQHIVILGESAGGGMALAMTLSMRYEEVPLPAALVLLSPWADLTRSGDSAYTLAPHSTLCWEADLADPAKAYTAGQDPTNPLISPVFAEYSGMPPMLIQVGTRDILMSDAIRVNHQALKAGVATTLDVWEGMFHVHQHSNLPESREAMDDITRFVQHAIR